MIYLIENKSSLLLIAILFTANFVYAQASGQEKKAFWKQLNYKFEVGVSQSEIEDEVSESYFNDAFKDKLDRAINLGNEGVFAGILIEHTSTDEATLKFETGLTYRKRGTDKSSKLILHNLQIPVTVLIDILPNRSIGPFLRSGMYSSYTISRENDRWTDPSRFDVGVNAGLGLKVELKRKVKFEIWGQIGLGRYFVRNRRSSPGGTGYIDKERSDFFEMGITTSFIK